MRTPQTARAAPRDADGDPQNARLGKTFKQTITESRSVRQDVLWLRRQFITECSDMITSLGISLGEAAWRGSDATVEVTLRQLRLTLNAAIKTFKEIDAAPNAGDR